MKRKEEDKMGSRGRRNRRHEKERRRRINKRIQREVRVRKKWEGKRTRGSTYKERIKKK